MAGGSYNHIHFVFFCQLHSQKIRDQTLPLPTDKEEENEESSDPTMAISTLTLTSSHYTRSFRPTISSSSSSSSSFSCLCSSSSSSTDCQQKQRSFTAAKTNVFGVGLGLLAATILSITPLDADATRIEYYATVGDPLCEYSYAKSGLGFCDIAVGFGDKAPRYKGSRPGDSWRRRSTSYARGKRKLQIPPKLAYGPEPAGCFSGDCNIPGNATLLYDINFVEIYPGSNTR
ncbi:hypothetical protein YC2023_006876 [Brassica napus]